GWPLLAVADQSRLRTASPNLTLRCSQYPSSDVYARFNPGRRAARPSSRQNPATTKGSVMSLENCPRPPTTLFLTGAEGWRSGGEGWRSGAMNRAPTDGGPVGARFMAP